MRISSRATEQYRKTSALAERHGEKQSVRPQATTTTTSFGFRLGKFGLDFQEQKTVLDPSLSRDVREREHTARAFRTEAEVESLRAKVGADGAYYRDRQTHPDTTQTLPKSRIQAALTAYAKSTENILPPPGLMLTSVV